MNEALGFLFLVAVPVGVALYYYRDNGQPEAVSPLLEEPPFPDVRTICLWADGTWCEEEYLEEYLGWMSDDFGKVVFIVEEDQTLEDCVETYLATTYDIRTTASA